MDSKEKLLKIIKILRKIKNAILHGLTHPTANRWKQTLVNAFLDWLLNKHVLPGHKLYKIFNKNSLKLRYSCMPNQKLKLMVIIRKYSKTHIFFWKKKKKNCPIRGACLIENVLYYARISCEDETEIVLRNLRNYF